MVGDAVGAGAVGRFGINNFECHVIIDLHYTNGVAARVDRHQIFVIRCVDQCIG